MPFIKLSDGTHIWYEIEGSSPFLVLNHGYDLNHKNFKFFIPILSESFSCLLWYQRGHDRSDKPMRETYEEIKSRYMQRSGKYYSKICI